MSLFIKFKGLKGESRDVEHPEWCHLIEFGHQLQVPLTPSKKGKGFIRGMVDFGNITGLKFVDTASGGLYGMLTDMEHIEDVTIHDTATFGGARRTFIEYLLQDCIITGLSLTAGEQDKTGARADSVPKESFILDFGRIRITYFLFSNAGVELGRKGMFWDKSKNSGSAV